jgi:phosphoglycolate phosphatase-like HAD superfamily hydrolase
MDDEQPTIAVDFDGVIANYDGWKGRDSIGTPRTDVVEVLETLRSEGWKIVVHSTRAAEAIRPYLIENKIPFDEINRNSSDQTEGTKPRATVYWDDRACCYSGDAHNDLATIRNFRTWNGRR